MSPSTQSRLFPAAVFEIAAAEDISTADGTVRHAAGELVDTKALVSFSNVRQKVAVTVKKQLEQNRDFGIGLGSEITGVTFGLYAAEELTVAYGLMDIISVDLEGKATCNADLPLGSHYLKELSADEHYLLSQDKYPFSFDYAGQDISLVEIAVNEGEVIVIEKGCRGYAPTGKYAENEIPQECVDSLYKAMGVTKSQAAAMKAGSMFGFDVPGADPANYDKQGVPVRAGRKQERGDAR